MSWKKYRFTGTGIESKNPSLSGEGQVGVVRCEYGENLLPGSGEDVLASAKRQYGDTRALGPQWCFPQLFPLRRRQDYFIQQGPEAGNHVRKHGRTFPDAPATSARLLFRVVGCPVKFACYFLIFWKLSG